MRMEQKLVRYFKLNLQELALLPVLFLGPQVYIASAYTYAILDGMNEVYALLFAVITIQMTYMISMTTKPLKARLQYPFEVEDALYKQRCASLATMTDVEFEKSKITLAVGQFHMKNIEKIKANEAYLTMVTFVFFFIMLICLVFAFMLGTEIVHNPVKGIVAAYLTIFVYRMSVFLFCPIWFWRNRFVM